MSATMEGAIDSRKVLTNLRTSILLIEVVLLMEELVEQCAHERGQCRVRHRKIPAPGTLLARRISSKCIITSLLEFSEGLQRRLLGQQAVGSPCIKA